ncbi:MAG: ATP-dependent DNA helicase [Deltaproteobacteria bacterium]|jgi:ATP-dependent DNA helicase DinG|nr:ATP-dependent DNA helicase [Deltaproteobacteria bacterium]
MSSKELAGQPGPGRIPLPRGIPHDTGELDYILKNDGELARRWRGFQPRHAQLKMFRETLRAFRDADITVIEAGTGTGKTLAYLLPAIISGKKTIVSTGLKNLQDQIYGKDLQFIREHFDSDFTAAVLKGRDSYVCLRRFEKAMRKRPAAQTDPVQKARFDTLEKWRISTEAGEISEISNKLTSSPPFNELTSTSEACLGKKCSCNALCFLQQARAKAASADIVLVNHYLLMIDLALHGTAASVLPPWDAVILDEAHLVEQVAIKSFSQKLSLPDLQNACYELANLLDRLMDAAISAGAGPGSERVATIMTLKASADNQQETAARLTAMFQKAPGSDELSYGELIWPEREKPERRGLKDALAKLHSELKDLEENSAKLFADADEDFTPVSRRLKAASETARFISAKSDPGFVYTVNAEDGNVELSAVPIDVSAYLREKLFDFTKTIVITSATMSSRKSLGYFNARIGVDERVDGLVLDSPFDYWSRTVMYVPKSMPPFNRENNHESFRLALVEEITKLLRVTRGRALVLFTSYSQLNWVHGRFARMRLPFKLLKQGDEPRTLLLETFRQDVSSVLMATASFWQGVDVPGQSLSAVIIDKLPFPVPTDPVHQARDSLLKKARRDGFNELSLPEMEIKLKQGLGRLIRSAGDWGLLAILDSRISSGYGPGVLQSISHGPITNDVEAVRKFFAKMEPPKKEPAGNPAAAPAQRPAAARRPSRS